MAAKGIEARLTRIEDAVSQRRLDEPPVMPVEERQEFAWKLASEIVEGRKGRMHSRFAELVGVNRQTVRSFLHYLSVCGRLDDGAARQISGWLADQGLRVV